MGLKKMTRGAKKGLQHFDYPETSTGGITADLTPQGFSKVGISKTRKVSNGVMKTAIADKVVDRDDVIAGVIGRPAIGRPAARPTNQSGPYKPNNEPYEVTPIVETPVQTPVSVAAEIIDYNPIKDPTIDDIKTVLPKPSAGGKPPIQTATGTIGGGGDTPKVLDAKTVRDALQGKTSLVKDAGISIPTNWIIVIAVGIVAFLIFRKSL